jgi:hypothetical protein
MGQLYDFQGNDGTEFIEAFSKAIFTKCEFLNSNKENNRSRKRMLESVTQDIRKVTDLCIPEASCAAAAVFRRMKVEYRSLTWQAQPKFDEGRKTFILEHYWPVVYIRSELLSCTNWEAVRDVLRDRPRLVWILREENRKLNQLGYSRNRPDPAKAYEEAGIEIENES